MSATRDDAMPHQIIFEDGGGVFGQNVLGSDGVTVKQIAKQHSEQFIICYDLESPKLRTHSGLAVWIFRNMADAWRRGAKIETIHHLGYLIIIIEIVQFYAKTFFKISLHND